MTNAMETRDYTRAYGVLGFGAPQSKDRGILLSNLGSPHLRKLSFKDSGIRIT